MKNLNLTTLFIWTFIILFTLTNCGPTDSEPVMDSDEVENEFVEKDYVKVDHQFGVSPCPQVIEEIDIRKNSIKRGLEIDSVSIQNDDARLNVFFSDTQEQQYQFADESETSCTFKFTCSDDESFESEVRFECFNDGSLVSTETVGVMVTIGR